MTNMVLLDIYMYTDIMCRWHLFIACVAYEYVFWKLTHFSFSLNLWKELISNSFERMTMMTTGNEGLYLFIYSVCSFLSLHISHENHSVCFGRKRTHTKKMILNQMHQRFSEVRLFSTFVLKTFVFWSQPRSVVASTFSNKWSHLSSATEFFSINIRLCYLMGIRAILLLLCSDGTWFCLPIQNIFQTNSISRLYKYHTGQSRYACLAITACRYVYVPRTNDTGKQKIQNTFVVATDSTQKHWNTTTTKHTERTAFRYRTRPFETEIEYKYSLSYFCAGVPWYFWCQNNCTRCSSRIRSIWYSSRIIHGIAFSNNEK